MSFGPFVSAKYESTNTGGIHPCRVQPETLTLTIGGTANAVPAGDIDNNRGVKMSGGKSRLTIGARAVGLRVTSDAGPYPDGSIHYVPVMQQSVLQGYLFPEQQTGTYNGSPVVVIGSRPER